MEQKQPAGIGPVERGVRRLVPKRDIGPSAAKVYALRWHTLPDTLPPKREDNDRWSQRVWLALPDGRVVSGDCHFAGPDATHGHAVHAWFGDRCQLDADPIAWMPFAVPDHPMALPAPSAA